MACRVQDFGGLKAIHHEGAAILHRRTLHAYRDMRAGQVGYHLEAVLKELAASWSASSRDL